MKKFSEHSEILPDTEGIFAEPASASSIAGLKKLVDQGLVERNEEIVCVVTGHGLKDIEIVAKIGEEPIRTKSNIGSIETALGLKLKGTSQEKPR